MKTLIIGRSPFADVIIADPSVAPHHAELVVTGDGRLHLTDCVTPAGSWRQGAAADGAAHGAGEGNWQAIRQAFITAEEPLKLGDYRCTAAELLKAKSGSEAAAGSGTGSNDGVQPGGGPEPLRRGLRGRLERNPSTGEIVRRRP